MYFVCLRCVDINNGIGLRIKPLIKQITNPLRHRLFLDHGINFLLLDNIEKKKLS